MMVFTKQGMVGECNATTLVAMNQMHSNEVVLIEQLDGQLVVRNGDGEFIPISMDSNHMNAQVSTFEECTYVIDGDAMITNEKGLALSVKTADCLPILIQSEEYVAVIHAGREGTIKGISTRVAESLKRLGVSSATAWFGPASCFFCYQVDRETNTYFDLVFDNKAQLCQVFGSSIEIQLSGLCTQCQSNEFYSYRSGDQIDRNVFYISRL